MIRCSYIEIYNERITDLLSLDDRTEVLEVREHKQRVSTLLQLELKRGAEGESLNGMPHSNASPPLLPLPRPAGRLH